MEIITNNNTEKRALLFKEQADQYMTAALGYEREADQVKADAQWALWTAKKLEIRTAYPD